MEPPAGTDTPPEIEPYDVADRENHDTPNQPLREAEDRPGGQRPRTSSRRLAAEAAEAAGNGERRPPPNN